MTWIRNTCRPIIRRSAAASVGRAAGQSRHARRARCRERCGAISPSSCPTAGWSKSRRWSGSRSCAASILTTRPKKSAHAYRQVWTEAGSPLAAITARRPQSCRRGWAMRCIVSPRDALRPARRSARAAGADGRRVRPHPARAALSAILAPRRPRRLWTRLADKLRTMRWQPALRTLPPYHDDPLYIDALAADLGAQLDALAFRARGAAAQLPRHAASARCELGDPYHCHCRKTARLLEKALGRARTCGSSPASSPASAAPSGSSRRPTRCWRRKRTGAPGGWRSRRRVFRPTASKRCEELAIRGRRAVPRSGRRAVRRARPASTPASRAWRCSRRWCGASLRAGSSVTYNEVSCQGATRWPRLPSRYRPRTRRRSHPRHWSEGRVIRMRDAGAYPGRGGPPVIGNLFRMLADPHGFAWRMFRKYGPVYKNKTHRPLACHADRRRGERAAAVRPRQEFSAPNRAGARRSTSCSRAG